MMDMKAKHLAVRKSITVEAPVAHVFRTFTARQNEWWPRGHHIGGCEKFTAIVESRAGGRWFERGDDGSECDWGRVLVWEEPNRIVLAWNLNAEWRYDPNLHTEVEVRFTAETPRRTRVDLEHRGLENFGEKAAAMRDTFDSPDAWAGNLALLRRCAETSAS
jgi:uncharacterized protein YndB with AHSA1/START domain